MNYRIAEGLEQNKNNFALGGLAQQPARHLSHAAFNRGAPNFLPRRHRRGCYSQCSVTIRDLATDPQLNLNAQCHYPNVEQ